MTKTILVACTAISILAASAGPALAQGLCEDFGAQSPRDISNGGGNNPSRFALAPAASDMNLCNIHFHRQAEHRGPGFALYAGPDKHGGYRCNDTATLSAAAFTYPDLEEGAGFCRGVVPGDTIEVHWVYTSCDVAPGPGLGSCLSDSCQDPTLRVEAQVFLVTGHGAALDFAEFAYDGHRAEGRPQPKALPSGTGEAATFRGSTTGPSYSESNCSPFQVTWNVRPQCARLSLASLNAWCADNVFKEDHAHGVRALVTAPSLLAPLK